MTLLNKKLKKQCFTRPLIKFRKKKTQENASKKVLFKPWNAVEITHLGLVSSCSGVDNGGVGVAGDARGGVGDAGRSRSSPKSALSSSGRRRPLPPRARRAHDRSTFKSMGFKIRAANSKTRGMYRFGPYPKLRSCGRVGVTYGRATRDRLSKWTICPYVFHRRRTRSCFSHLWC